MFYFNRVIVDEFHQYEPREYASIKALKSDKRWLLSGTPAIDDFYNVARMAGLLGVPLRIGSDMGGIMKMKNIRELRKDWTEFERFHAMLDAPCDATHARIHLIDQSFMDTFVRRNVIDFEEMKLTEHLVPVSLDLDHRALYTKLSQHLNSTEMKIRKGKASYHVDRDERLHAAVTGSNNVGEALSKTAVSHDRDNIGDEGLFSLVQIRKTEVQDLLEQMIPAVQKAQQSEPEAFESWRRERLDGRTLSDEHTIMSIREIISNKVGDKPLKNKAEPKATAEYNNDDDVGKGASKKALTTSLNKLANRLLLSQRSLRYLESVDRLAKAA